MTDDYSSNHSPPIQEADLCEQEAIVVFTEDARALSLSLSLFHTHQDIIDSHNPGVPPLQKQPPRSLLVLLLFVLGICYTEARR